jgi:hypothetical protein
MRFKLECIIFTTTQLFTIRAASKGDSVEIASASLVQSSATLALYRPFTVAKYGSHYMVIAPPHRAQH